MSMLNPEEDKKSKSEYRAEEITAKETDNRIETMKESLEDIED